MSTAVDALWWVVPLLAAISAGVYVLARRDQRIVKSMFSLLTEGRHAEVLAHQLPSRPNRHLGLDLQACSAVLTGQFARALELLGAARRPKRGSRAMHIALLRAEAFCGLGRYREAAELLGDDPTEAPLRRIRAGAAIETGDDSVAERLLSTPDADPLDEAGRRRLLGTLRLRRGRSADGEALVRDAQRMYAELEDAGADVDQAVCDVLIGQARLREGHTADALRILNTGLAGLARRPDNAADLSHTHALLAEAHAEAGDRQASEQHLAAATEHAQRCGSPALDAHVARATGVLAARLGSREEAREALTDAQLRYEALGALPDAALIREKLDRLEA